MNLTLQKDIVTLNRRYLLLIQQMALAKHPLLSASTPKTLVKAICNLSLEEIDQLAEDMIAPCFRMNLNEIGFERMQKLQPGERRKAFMTNVLVTQPQKDE